MNMYTEDLVLFLRTLVPSTYGFTEQIRAGVLELLNRDIDEIVAYGGLDMLVTLLMENVGDGPLHLLGFKTLIKVAEKYKHLVRLTAASQVAEQIMQIHVSNHTNCFAGRFIFLLYNISWMHSITHVRFNTLLGRNLSCKRGVFVPFGQQCP